jgi:predicted transcriptional regulator
LKLNRKNGDMIMTETQVQDQTKTRDFNTIIGNIVASYVGHNTVDAEALPALITNVRKAMVEDPSFASAENAELHPEREIGTQEPLQELKRPTPAEIRKSVTTDNIISFEDGRKFRTLKRHLTSLGMTPEEYRQKWGLPADYPMVAQSFSELRSKVAKQTGLGKNGRGGRRKAPEPAPARTKRAYTRRAK